METTPAQPTCAPDLKVGGARGEMVTLVSELSQRRTAEAEGQREHQHNTEYPVPSPEPLGGNEMSRAAGRRPGLSAGQLAAATASPLLSLLLLLACCADACRGKIPASHLRAPQVAAAQVSLL